MPLSRPLMLMLLAAGLLYGAAAVAQTRAEAPAAPVPPPVDNSRIDAPLFYELLIGEMELRDGDGGTAYEIYLDAARRLRDENLFQRATDIAIQARAGEQALAAARAWSQTLPKSLDAGRYEVQILAGMGRVREAVEPLKRVISLVPPADRVGAIAALPRYFARNTDAKESLAVVEQVLQPYTSGRIADEPASTVAAWAALGRMRLAAGDAAGSLDALQRAQALDPRSESAAVLAVELMPKEPRAEDAIKRFLAAEPPATAAVRQALRLMYARALAGQQRYADAVPLLEQITRETPELADAWLALGALRLELKQPQAAELALKTYLERIDATGNTDEEAEDGATPTQRRAQAYLLLAQAAEQRRDFAAADAWLSRVEDPDQLAVQARRASLLARQGKLEQARALLRQIPERSPEVARAKLLAETQLLREAQQWTAAREVLVQANAKFPDDVDLLYEQAMLDEKLGRVDEMEVLLRRVIALKPSYHHAYNALGYSLADRNLRLPEARELIRKALELAPGDPFLVDSLGWVEYRMGNRDEAIKWLRQAFQARPDPEIAAHLGEVLWVAGQRDEARRVLREARNRDAANEVLKETLARLKVDL
ncbi:tetratricopeptide repeat protein [Rivibacter subsaxonicus]|uniref:Flp pilus assembly protein TadD n=1 Tax=Rivibacter subsaxonicus TaxID=457575 RepID=A0A4Q7VGA2_9BURK|nr:tetratricopeptide repeat protein [Rivibacter subsaxonicus]RZT95051.1 Flp pilus assembly protein TadD [Rivibacter subsaxonicus]